MFFGAVMLQYPHDMFSASQNEYIPESKKKMRQNGETLDLLKKMEDLGIPSMDCVVYSKGKCVFRYQSGFSDTDHTRKVDGSERYNIYSCSKVITCCAALQLLEKDVIRLEDPLYEFLPEFKDMTKKGKDGVEKVNTPITLRHLFTMTAGFTYNVFSENLQQGKKESSGRLSTRDAMKYLARDPLAFEPGERWSYSLCHDVLAAVVEVVSGKRFGAYVKENIFDRAGMKNSTFLLPEAELPQIAAQYRYNPEGKRYIPCGPEIQSFKLGSEYESGGAGCISCVDDYIAFLEALRTGETLLSRKTVDRMTVPQIARRLEKDLMMQEYSYGLGVRCPRPGTGVLDYGWGGAAGAYLAVIPEKEVTLYYAQHVLASPVQQMRRLLPETVLKDLL